jgi:hypothetical protein
MGVGGRRKFSSLQQLVSNNNDCVLKQDYTNILKILETSLKSRPSKCDVEFPADNPDRREELVKLPVIRPFFFWCKLTDTLFFIVSINFAVVMMKMFGATGKNIVILVTR